jgi:hypothetical protein
MPSEMHTPLEISRRLNVAAEVLSAKIGIHGSATHHFANMIASMSLTFAGSLSHWPSVVEYAGKLASGLRKENLSEWRSLVADAMPFLEEASHLAIDLGVLKFHLLEHTLDVTKGDSVEHVAQIAQYACLLAHSDKSPRNEIDVPDAEQL